MINLCLVVIATQFSETKKRETERMLQERKRFHSSSTLASNSEPGGCYEEIMKYVAHILRRVKRKVSRLLRRSKGCRIRKVTPEKAISLRCKRKKKKGGQTLHLHHHHHHHHHHYHISNTCNTNTPSPRAPRASPEVSDVDPMSSPRRPNYLMVPGENLPPSPLPSTESLQTITYTTDLLASHDPNLLKSQKPSSPNHLPVVTTLSISRAGSYNDTNMGSNQKLAIIPSGVLALHGAKNAALAATNTLLNKDYDVNKLHPIYKGMTLLFMEILNNRLSQGFHHKTLVCCVFQCVSLILFCL